ncbi:MAG TPA: hypothetical protein EYN00_00960 [Planctomycetes bacterium]|nr:hypothetical protein [Planctomycetota bacterium]
MKIFKRSLIIVLLLLLLFFVIGRFLPADYAVERSATIAAPAEAIFLEIANLERWPEWGPWNESEYPSMKSEFSGAASGVGAVWTWTMDEGDGSMTITSAEPTRGIFYEIEVEQGTYLATGIIELAEAEAGTEVTWTQRGDLDGAIARWFGLFFDSMMGPDFEEGLIGLEAAVKGG